MSLTVKAVHLELVSDLTADAFIACPDDLYLAMVFLPSYGVTMVLTLWGQLVKSKISINFYETAVVKMQSPSSSQQRTSIGNSFLKTLLILEASGRLL